MKTLKSIIFVIIIIPLVLIGAKFITQNGDSIPIKLFDWTSEPIPLYVIVFVSFGIGLLLMTIFTVFGILKSEFKLISQRKKIDKLEKELSATKEAENETHSDEPEYTS